MDFFGTQDSRRQQSVLLLVFFAAAMLAMAAVVHVLSVFMAYPSTGSLNFSEPSVGAKAFIAIIWFTCLIGCFFRFIDVRAGGVALAKRFGAVEANTSGRYEKEGVLVDIVNEISVASSSDMPRVFILHREQAINAFVVGGFKGKEALVVSQGAIDKLSREELSAVVAHEFGHITQGDIPMNMRLLVALGGLNAIDEVGKLLMVESEGKMLAQPGAIVGFVIRAIGSIGVFFGRMFRSAISRQREFLADACAVQFTRMPEHVAAALAIVRDEHDDEGIHSVHAEELAHLCFQVGDINAWQKRLFATHPPIQKRIDAIDPHFSIKSHTKKRQAKDKQPQLYSVGNGISAMPMSGADDTPSTAISDAAAMVLTDKSSCLAVLHAVFVSDNIERRREYYKAIGFAYNKVFASQVKEVHDRLHHELHTNQLAIIENATQQLRDSIKFENRQRFLKSLEKLIAVEGEYTLMNYATLQLVRRKLDAEFPVLETVSNADNQLAQASQVKTFDTMGQEFALLLSLMIESSGNNKDTLDNQFQMALKCYTKDQLARRSSDEPGIVKELEASFQTLYVQPRPIREAFVRHCLELAQSDGHVAKDERALLELFAASLKCEAIAA